MMKLMYITNNPHVAQIIQNAGVDRIFIDMEYIGKVERQGKMDTVQNHHTVDDIRAMKTVQTTAEILVRINPIHEFSQQEIDESIEAGADIIMLPYFKTVEEVKTFISMVNGRAKIFPLLETKEALEIVDEILDLEGIDEILIGLNDLSLSYHMPFMFELLSNGTVEMLCKKFKAKGILYGFGGFGRPGSGILPAEAIIKEHYRLGSRIAILSRSFCNTDMITDEEEIKSIFTEGIKEIRDVEKECMTQDENYFEENRKFVVDVVNTICEAKR